MLLVGRLRACVQIAKSELHGVDRVVDGWNKKTTCQKRNIIILYVQFHQLLAS